MTSHGSRVLPHSALSAHAHDRHGNNRDDATWLDERFADPATRVLVIAGARLRPVDGRIDWVSPQEAPDGLRVLLGERDGVHHFAVIVDPSDAPGDREEWVVLRAIVQSLATRTWPTPRWCCTRSGWPNGGGRPGTARAAGAGWSRGRQVTCCAAPTAARTSSRAPTRP